MINSHNTESVPVLNLTLKLHERVEKARSLFKVRFQKHPQFFVRVPGRVNLIGEHVDYCGYGVCPMAIKQDIVLAVASVHSDNILTISNTNALYPEFECPLNDFKIEVNGSPTWYQYFLCGVKGVLELLPSSTPLKGMQVVVDGIIPQSAGLSSSSALVSAAAVATAYIHDLQISREKLSNLCASSERYIGTQGGGMDQAIAFLATEGCAKLIEFGPLRTKDVMLPTDAVFVICHSLVEMNKAATSDYNCRVVECRLAAQLLAKKESQDWKEIKTLSDVQNKLGKSLTEMVALVEKHLHTNPYSKNEIIEELETTCDILEKNSLTVNTKNLNSFKLKQRALHVYQEAERVQKFYETCKTSKNDALYTLGQLMYESHESLKTFYECSHPQLDRIVELSKKVCFGARLTGAGWGGCAVALLSPQNVDEFISLLKKEYYEEIGCGDKNYDSIIFVTAPHLGAAIYKD